MSGSTSFGKKRGAAYDPAAVAKLTPDSSADDLHIPTVEDKQKRKKKKKKKGKEDGKEKGKGEAKTEADAAGGQQVRLLRMTQKVVPLKLVP